LRKSIKKTEYPTKTKPLPLIGRGFFDVQKEANYGRRIENLRLLRS